MMPNNKDGATQALCARANESGVCSFRLLRCFRHKFSQDSAVEMADIWTQYDMQQKSAAHLELLLLLGK